MIDLSPLATMTEWAIAALLAFLILLIVGIFADVQLWWMAPVTAGLWGVFKLTLFRR
jgi:hypothetical protein